MYLLFLREAISFTSWNEYICWIILKSKLSSWFAMKFIVNLDYFFHTFLKWKKKWYFEVYKCIESHFSWEKNPEENWTLVSASLEIKKK